MGGPAVNWSTLFYHVCIHSALHLAFDTIVYFGRTPMKLLTDYAKIAIRYTHSAIRKLMLQAHVTAAAVI
jgi:hypothetical protein